jgi:translation initiation factor IF-3
MEKIKKQKNRHKVFQLSLGIQEHDMKYRAKNVITNMSTGHCSVSLIIRVRGRQILDKDYRESVQTVFDKFVSFCNGQVEQTGETTQNGDTWKATLRYIGKEQK